LPVGVKAFWYEPQIPYGNLTITPNLPNGNYINWILPFMANGASYTIDVFVKYDDPSPL
jgi:hypothetical protein